MSAQVFPQWLVLALSCLALCGCINLSVYGPWDDFSGLGNDFISLSVRDHVGVMKINTHPSPEEGARILVMEKQGDPVAIRQAMIEADSSCGEPVAPEMQCVAERQWKTFYPKPPNGLRGREIDVVAYTKVRVVYSFLFKVDLVVDARAKLASRREVIEDAKREPS